MKKRSVFGMNAPSSLTLSTNMTADNTYASTASDSIFASFDSYIIEKLVAERLKLGIVKTKHTESKRSTRKSQSTSTIVTKKSSGDRLSTLAFCYDKYEKSNRFFVTDSSQEIGEPTENPVNVIQPDFSEQNERLPDYKDPSKDVLMQLNRTRSFYTPKGFRDHRIDLKLLEAEGENVWARDSDDRYTKFLFQEAVKPLKHIRLRDDNQESESVDGNVALRNVHSLISLVKLKELPPSEWDLESVKRDKFTPYWAYAPKNVADKTINKIRYIYTILKNADLKADKKKKMKMTGKAATDSRMSDEEETGVVESEQEESEDEPYLLKRKETWLGTKAKKKPVVVEVKVEDVEVQQLEARSGHHNIQEGHELSISNIQNTYPPTPPSSGDEQTAPSDISFSPISHVKESSFVKTTSTTVSMLRPSWIKQDELEELASEESLYDLNQPPKPRVPEAPEYKPCIRKVDGFPRIVKPPKWIPLIRECIEKEGEDLSHVERYRCLCVQRGIPPCEAVARSINKKSAIMNRLGVGPSGTIQTIAEVLGVQTKIINLSGFSMIKNDVCQLVKSLNRFVNLAKLQLSRTKMTGEMFALIVNNLKKCDKLCLLDVSYNNITKVTSAMMKALPASLKSLDLSHCNLGNDSFFGLFQLNPNVRALNLSWNRLNDAAALRFLAMRLIRRRSKLRDLRLSWNCIEGDWAARAIGLLPMSVVPLVYLDLSYNKFGTPEDMVCFNEMLMGARKLKYLLLGGNPLSQPGVQALINDLNWAHKPTLRLIDLGDLWIDKDLYLVCEDYKEIYGVELRIGGIKGNIEVKSMDMAEIYMRRLNFLNAGKKKRKKKKKVKDLATCLTALMENEEVTKMKRGRVLTFLESQKLKVEAGLLEALTKSISDSHKNIDLEAAVLKYRTLFPEDPRDAKSDKSKKKKKEDSFDQIPIVDICPPNLVFEYSDYNVAFIENESFIEQLL